MKYIALKTTNFSLLSQLKVLLVLIVSLMLSVNIHAAIITVNNDYGGTGAPGCSLADAIIAANTANPSSGCSSGSVGMDEIQFASGFNGATISLLADLPVITDDLIINGPPGQNPLAISGNNNFSIFIVEGVRLNLTNLILKNGVATASSILLTNDRNGGAIAAMAGALVNVRKTTFTGNYATTRGGAIYAEDSSSVTLNKCRLSNNTSRTGGAIASFFLGNVNVLNSTFSNNASLSSSGYGGAITVDGMHTPATGIYVGSTLNVRNSNFFDNTSQSYGGAIMVQKGSSAEVLDSKFVDNYAHTGGAFYVQDNAASSIARSEFAENTAINGAGVAAESADLNVLNSTFLNNNANKGGAVFSYGAKVNLNTITASGNNGAFGAGAIAVMGSPYYPHNVQLIRSYLYENTTLGGFGGAVTVENAGYMKISSSTLANNYAMQLGGALLADGSIVEIQNSTLSSNDSGIEGGGVYARNASSLKIDNTTLAENMGGSLFSFSSSTAVLQNTVIAGGHCDQDSSSNVVLVGGVHIDDGTCGATSVGPSQLGPLAINGSDPIPTHLPIVGSPLVDHGIGGVSGNPAIDQRGLSRVVGIEVDIGAVELQDPEM